MPARPGGGSRAAAAACSGLSGPGKLHDLRLWGAGPAVLVYLSLRVQHPMPRHAGRTAPHRAPDRARRARKPSIAATCPYVAVRPGGIRRTTSRYTAGERRRRAPRRLQLPQSRVEPAAPEQLRVAPSSCTRPRCSTRIRSALWIVESRCAMVRRRSSRQQARHRIPDQRFGLRIDARRRLVQHEDCADYT